MEVPTTQLAAGMAVPPHHSRHACRQEPLEAAVLHMGLARAWPQHAKHAGCKADRRGYGLLPMAPMPTMPRVLPASCVPKGRPMPRCLKVTHCSCTRLATISSIISAASATLAAFTPARNMNRLRSPALKNNTERAAMVCSAPRPCRSIHAASLACFKGCYCPGMHAPMLCSSAWCSPA